MNAKLLTVKIEAQIVGRLWMGGEGCKEVSTRVHWRGSLRNALAALLQNENGRDFQRGTVRIEAANVRYAYTRSNPAFVHYVTCAVPESAVNAVNS